MPPRSAVQELDQRAAVRAEAADAAGPLPVLCNRDQDGVAKAHIDLGVVGELEDTDLLRLTSCACDPLDLRSAGLQVHVRNDTQGRVNLWGDKAVSRHNLRIVVHLLPLGSVSIHDILGVRSAVCLTVETLLVVVVHVLCIHPSRLRANLRLLRRRLREALAAPGHKVEGQEVMRRDVGPWAKLHGVDILLDLTVGPANADYSARLQDHC
mmetsp:Transcript_30873/g.88502  ORF Transcript_30873/g.88502 Transcript_30873/m.88502 type:complete len:210 (-) Transcript_30873:277-906(-)